MPETGDDVGKRCNKVDTREYNIFNGVGFDPLDLLLPLKGPWAFPPGRISELIPGGAPLSFRVSPSGKLADCFLLGGGVLGEVAKGHHANGRG